MAIPRAERVIFPQPDNPFETGDELRFVTTADVEERIRAAIRPSRRAPS